MTREEHLKFCKVCQNKAFDREKGIICSLTGNIADFEDSCASFQENTEIAAKEEENKGTHGMEAQMASMEKRLINFIIDFICYGLFSLFMGIMMGIMIGIFYPEWLDHIPENNRLFDYVLGVTMGLIYYGFLEFLTGKTIGKYITKTKVVTVEGEQADLKTCLFRSLCRFIPFEPFTFLFGGNTGLHDKLSKTLVIDDVK